MSGGVCIATRTAHTFGHIGSTKGQRYKMTKELLIVTTRSSTCIGVWRCGHHGYIYRIRRKRLLYGGSLTVGTVIRRDAGTDIGRNRPGMLDALIAWPRARTHVGLEAHIPLPIGSSSLFGPATGGGSGPGCRPRTHGAQGLDERGRMSGTLSPTSCVPDT